MKKIEVVYFEKIQSKRPELLAAFVAGKKEMLGKVIEEVLKWEEIPAVKAGGFHYTLIDALFDLKVD